MMSNEETVINQTNPTPSKSHRHFPFSIILTILLVCSIAVSGVSVFGTFRSNQILKKIQGQIGTPEDPGTEDDITIMNQYTIRPTTNISDAYRSGETDNLNDREKETLTMAKEILNSIITDNMTDYDKESAVYSWLTKELKNDTGLLTVIPTSSEDSDNPYGVLKFRNAVCVGYATTFRMFMQMLGIDCKVIHSSDLIHSWDLVRLEDDWYHVDCYMDSDTGNFRNFNISDEIASADHQWNHEFFPAATGVKYSYTMMNCTEIKDLYAIPSWLKGLLDQKATVGSCSFAKKIAKEDEDAASVMVDTLISALSSTGTYSDYSFESRWSMQDDRGYILTMYITNDNEEPSAHVDNKTQEKINQKISDAFDEEMFDFSYQEGHDYNSYDNAKG